MVPLSSSSRSGRTLIPGSRVGGRRGAQPLEQVIELLALGEAAVEALAGKQKRHESLLSLGGDFERTTFLQISGMALHAAQTICGPCNQSGHSSPARYHESRS